MSHRSETERKIASWATFDFPVITDRLRAYKWITTIVALVIFGLEDMNAWGHIHDNPRFFISHLITFAVLYPLANPPMLMALHAPNYATLWTCWPRIIYLCVKDGEWSLGSLDEAVGLELQLKIGTACFVPAALLLSAWSPREKAQSWEEYKAFFRAGWAGVRRLREEAERAGENADVKHDLMEKGAEEVVEKGDKEVAEGEARPG